MRLQQGQFVVTVGLGLAGLGAVTSALRESWLTWGLLFGGLLLALSGLFHALRGKTPDELRDDSFRKLVSRNALNAERRSLEARLEVIDGDVRVKNYHKSVATAYKDALHEGLRAGEVASLLAERDYVVSRITEIDAELSALS